MKKFVKKEKAITLIALVITIIVLLILSGIAVAQLSGNNLFENAKLAKEKYQKAREQEDEIIGDYEDAIMGDRGKMISYSTQEQDTGLTWIDGKTVFQKTISQTKSSGEQIEISISSLQIDSLIDARGFISLSTGEMYQLNNTYLTTSGTNGDILAFTTFSKNIIDIRLRSDKLSCGKTANITIQYTKTTN